MNTKQRAQVPFGLKKKLMAATSMLLVAAIMLVSTSYAWFTLSTAPEITGITTSVGANGNLEIALLNTETAADMSLITSNTGDSMEASGQSLTKANITWGNLIDLSDASYGLNSTGFQMYPSALNLTDGLLTTAPLATPTYGADGRVKQLDAATISAIYDGAAFTDNGINDMGVRAVGTADNVSPRQLVFKTAKSTALSKMDNAAAPVRSAFIQNKGEFMTLALSMQDGASATYTYEQVSAMKAFAVGVESALKNVVNAYANAGLATVAADERISDDAVALCNQQLAGATTAAELQAALNTAGFNGYNTQLTALAEEQADAAAVTAAANALLSGRAEGYKYGAANFTYNEETMTEQKAVNDLIVTPLLGGVSYVKAYGTGDDPSTTEVETDAVYEVGLSTSTIADVDNMYMTGGSVGAIANYSGTYKIDYLDVAGLAAFTVYGGVKDTAGTLAGLKTTVSGLESPGVTSAATVITTTYGYIIDFAFRTNAAGSNLLLQTEAANRVYSDATADDLATMGGGSTATFEYTTGLTQAQGERLLSAIRVVFFDPTTGTVLKGGQFTNIAAGTGSATGELELRDVQTVKTTNYVLGKSAYSTTADGTMDVPVSYALKESIPFGGTTATFSAENTVNYGENKLITAVKFETLPAQTALNADDMYVLGQDAFAVSESKTVNTHSILATTITVGDVSVTLSDANCTNFATVVTAEEYADLADATTPVVKTTISFVDAADGNIIALAQNEPQKVSVLVYMDGENIDNSAVANGDSSGSLKLNLQFASDATLKPMENSALKTMTASTT